MSPEEKNIRNQVLALAGLAQAATLVDKLARTGIDDSESYATLVHALLQTDPPSTEATFIDKNHLRSGLATLRHLLAQEPVTDREKNYSEILRYMLSMVHLESKLSKRNEMLTAIGKRLGEVNNQVTHFSSSQGTNLEHNGLLHPAVIANIALIYTDTISTFRFRIQVNGNPRHLQDETVINKIRALLLCGIRCAVLWHQVGGSRFRLLWNRKQHAEIADSLLKLH